MAEPVDLEKYRRRRQADEDTLTQCPHCGRSAYEHTWVNEHGCSEQDDPAQ